MAIDTFGRILIEQSVLLKTQFAGGKTDQHFAAWRAYMRRIPRCGAIILSPAMDKVLMIQPYGAKGWQFPRGKLNAEETHKEAAAREVMEECGVDVRDLLREDRFIEKRIDGTLHKLFIAFPMAETVATSIKCKKEIAAIKWISISDLPCTAETGRNFFGVWPFVPTLRQWIRKRTTVPDQHEQRDEAFDEEQEVSASAANAVNVATFGANDGGQKGWSFEAMLAANQRLGYKPAKVLDQEDRRRIPELHMSSPPSSPGMSSASSIELAASSSKQSLRSRIFIDGNRLLQIFVRAWKGNSKT
jgi:ADP-ribose pyrophosphatase YjhB (NUDIX family)